jgi:hypothetical protein
MSISGLLFLGLFSYFIFSENKVLSWSSFSLQSLIVS